MLNSRGSRGAVGILGVTAQRRHFKFAVICNIDADSIYLRERSFELFSRCHSILCVSGSRRTCKDGVARARLPKKDAEH